MPRSSAPSLSMTRRSVPGITAGEPPVAAQPVEQSAPERAEPSGRTAHSKRTECRADATQQTHQIAMTALRSAARPTAALARIASAVFAIAASSASTSSTKTSPGPWDAFADVDVFVDEVLAELAAMAKDGTRPMRSGPKPPLAEQRCARPSWRSGVFVCVACSGGRSDCCATFRSAHFMGCSPAGLRSASGAGCSTGCAVPGGSPAVIPPEPSAVVIDSRSCRSAPSSLTAASTAGRRSGASGSMLP